LQQVIMSANELGFILALAVAAVFLAIVGVIVYRMRK
jgi:hypothetical protein